MPNKNYMPQTSVTRLEPTGYMAPGSPEALAVIERIKSEARSRRKNPVKLHYHRPGFRRYTEGSEEFQRRKQEAGDVPSK